MKVLRELLLKKFPKQGSGQSPEVFLLSVVSIITDKKDFVKEKRE